jgi:hypothetical protein
MTTKKKTEDKPTETEFEHDLRLEGVVLDIRIRDLEMNIEFAKSLVTTLTRIHEDVLEVRSRVSMYNRAGSVRDSWMLPPPARREER